MLNLEAMLLGKARLVAHVTRFAGTPLHRRESVAEHSYMTAQYAFMIAKHCERAGSRPIDLGMLLARALVHDLDEAVMVDLPRPIKYADAALKERWTVMCNKVIENMGDELGVPILGHWMFAKDDSLEGQILALADLISVTAYVIEEIKFGNSYMVDVLRGNVGYLQEFLNKPRLSNEIRALMLEAIRIAQRYLPNTPDLATSDAPDRRPDRSHAVPARNDVRLLACEPDGRAEPHVS